MHRPPNPDLRIDTLTGRKVIVSANRSERPIHVAKPIAGQQTRDDPFLEGNEHETPSEQLALRLVGSDPDSAGWLLRVVPNRYPAVTQTSPATVSPPDVRAFPITPAIGYHEVVIECPDHRSRLADLSVAEVARILFAWQRRLEVLLPQPGIDAVHIFRNEGAMAGASLPHCHSQIIAAGFSVAGQSFRTGPINVARHVDTDHSVYDRWLSEELDAQRRIVSVSEDFVVVCPFASRVSGHIRLCPNSAGSRETVPFAELNDGPLREFAAMLLSVVKALHQWQGDIHFNLLLTLPPTKFPQSGPWMLDLIPRGSQFAGFELLTDVDIITTAPETAAAQLRDTMDWLTADADNVLLCPKDYHWFWQSPSR